MATTELIMTGNASPLEAEIARAIKTVKQLEKETASTKDKLNKGFKEIGGAVSFLSAGLTGLGDSIVAVTNFSRDEAIRADQLARAHNDVAQATLDMAQAMADAEQAIVDADQAMVDMEQAALDLEQAQVDARQAQRDVARAALDLEQAYRDAAQAALDLRQAERDLAQAQLDTEQALLDQEKAQLDYAEAVAMFGPQSIEARQALLDLKQAQEDVKQAELDAAQAQEDALQAELDAKVAAEDAAQAEVDRAQAMLDGRQATLDARQATVDYTQAQLDYEQATRDAQQATIDAAQAQVDLNEAQRAAIPPTAVQKWAEKLSALSPILFTLIGLQWLWNTSLLASPITWIVLGIAALIAGIVLLVKHWDDVKEAGAKAWEWIKDKASDAWEWLKSLPGKIGEAFEKIGEFISKPFRAAFNLVSDAWNNTIGKLSWTVPSWVPGLGGNTISAPKLPRFHAGGVVPGGPGDEMLVALRGGERVVPPGGSGQPVTIVIDSAGSDVDKLLVKVLARAIRAAGGNVQAVVGW